MTRPRLARILAAILLPIALVFPTEAPAQCSSSPHAYITNSTDHTVSVINTATRTTVATITVGTNPFTACVLPDGSEVYVTNFSAGTVSVIEPETNMVTDTVAAGISPWGVAAHPLSTEVYVSDVTGDAVLVIDTATKMVTDTISAGESPKTLSVLPDGSEVYVVNHTPGASTVSVIDTVTKTVTDVITVGMSPLGLAITPDGSEVYVSNQMSDDVSVIDTATKMVTDTIPTGPSSRGVAVHPDGSEVYVTTENDGSVRVIDTATKTVTDTVAIGGLPQGVGVHPDGTEIYVACNFFQIKIVDTTTKLVTGTVNVGSGVFAFGDFFREAAPVDSLQSVFLDFGMVGVPVDKASKDVFKEDGSILMTLMKGPRAGFDPEDIGYPMGTDRDMVIQQIVAQIESDFMTTDGKEFDISLETGPPDVAVFSTISIIEGDYPDMVVANSVVETEIRVEASTARLLLNGGTASGYFVLIQDGQLRRPDNSPVPGEVFPELKRIRVNAFGVAQQLDKGNLDKNKNAWVFVGHHASSGDPDDNRRELANSISHELSHLLGMEHRDAQPDGILGRLISYGTDKEFSFTATDKMTAILPPCDGGGGVASGLRVRRAKIGDTDQYGTSEPGMLTGVPDEDAAAIMREARRLLEPHVTHEPRFEVKIADITQSDPEDGLFTDIELAAGTSATYSLDLMDPGLDGEYAGGRIEIEITSAADVLGEPDDFKVFVDGLELHDALDGLDQRLTDPELTGYAAGERVTLFLHDYLNVSQIETVLADGVLEVTLEVDGDTPSVAVDSILAVVTDYGPDAIRECGLGTVNLAGGRRSDVLFLNGTAGGALRTVPVDEGDLLWTAILLPPAGGAGKFVIHLNAGAPDESSVTALPASIGTSCFPMLLPAAAPLSVWNNIGKTHLVGESNYFGSSIGNPGKAPEVFLALTSGDVMNLPMGTTVTFQGVIMDPETHSSKGVSSSNAVILEVH